MYVEYFCFLFLFLFTIYALESDSLAEYFVRYVNEAFIFLSNQFYSAKMLINNIKNENIQCIKALLSMDNFPEIRLDVFPFCFVGVYELDKKVPLVDIFQFFQY